MHLRVCVRARVCVLVIVLYQPDEMNVGVYMLPPAYDAGVVVSL